MLTLHPQDSDAPPAAAETAVAIEPGAPATEPGADGGAAPKGGLFDGMMMPLILVLVVFYFVMIGPERKNRRKREEMLKALKKGDRVMTSSGIFGSVAQVQDDVVTLQVADGVRLRMSRQAIQGPEGEAQMQDAPPPEKK